MYMTEKRWDAALEEFRSSFQCLVESGNSRALTMLKYVLLASLLAGSEVDQMSTNEAKIYAGDASIIGMNDLKEGLVKNQIETIKKVLADKQIALLADPFIKTYVGDLLRTARLNALEAVCKPYKTVKLDFLAAKMDVEVAEIRSLLSELILEDRMEGQIDQLNGFLELRSREGQVAHKHRAMQVWGDKLLDVHKQLLKKVSQR